MRYVLDFIILLYIFKYCFYYYIIRGCDMICDLIEKIEISFIIIIKMVYIQL